MSHVRCITDTHMLAEGATWCGKPADQFEWRFTDIDHAAMNGRSGGYLTVCPRCRAAVVAGLKNKTAEVPMGDVVNLKDPCVELRAQIERITAERDALKKEIDGQPDITVVGCTFDGKNADGSQVMTYEVDGEFVKLNTFKMIGWNCLSPSKWEELQQRLTAADERADVLEGLLRRVPKGVGGLNVTTKKTLWDEIQDALKPAEVARCTNCDRATVEQCDDAGCGFLGAGNGAPE